MPKYELSLSPDYIPDWAEVEAIRELFQNALDQETLDPKHKMSWSWNDDDKHTFIISSANSKLSRRSLLLGESSKTKDEQTIGTFGEGYKLAFLVLTRMGYKVSVANYTGSAKEIWTPRISKTKRYEGDILVVDIDAPVFPKKNMFGALTFVIEGIKPETFAEIERSNLHIKQPTGQVLEARQGRILDRRYYKGRIFVNGLYVTTIKGLEYGYDLKPKYLTIGRDRNLVSSFDIQWVTGQMWINVNKPGLVSGLIDAKAKDIEYVRSFAGKESELAKTIWANFVGKNGNRAVPVKDQAEYDLVKRNYKNLKPVIVPEQVRYITSYFSGQTYATLGTKREDKRAPHQVLEDFFKGARWALNDIQVKDFKSIIKKSRSWTYR